MILKGLEDISEVITRLIKGVFIVGYGRVIEVVNKGSIRKGSGVVGVESINSNGKTFRTVAYLLNISSKNIQVYEEPSVGDKVILMSPQYYNSKMFFDSYSRMESSVGYCPEMSFAIPFGAFSGDAKFTVDIDEEKCILKTGDTSIVLNDSGDISIGDYVSITKDKVKIFGLEVSKQ